MMSEHRLSQDRSWFMVGPYMDGANLTTGLNILIGMSAVIAARSDAIGISLLLVFVATILDHVDGYLARRFYASRARSRAFGKQFDTLADLLNFNVVPAVLLLELYPLLPGAPVAALLVLCGCIRLAHFNINEAEGGREYLGIPTTYVGFALIIILMVARAGFVGTNVVLALGGLLSLLQIARIKLRIPSTGVCVLVLSTIYGATLMVCGFQP